MNPSTDKTVSVLVDGARKNLKENTELCPCFFIGHDGELEVIGAAWRDDGEKNMIAAMMKQKVAELDADFVLFIAESYSLKNEDAQDYIDNRQKYGSASNHPNAKEVVMFRLETKDKVWSAMADILPGREMGSIKWAETPLADGRFSNFFQKKQTMQ